ncbi:MAG: aldehyde dehydrogenase (NADP(+)) [Verrucomicrobiales bacterium]|nr:aldehyde dehydrogenase (NADP(+)) [Verrucomicrobiales bacterium]
MSNLQGLHLIAGIAAAESSDTFSAKNPKTGETLEPVFHESTLGEIDRAMNAAADAFDEFRHTTPEQRAEFLEAIADETLALGDEFLERTEAETGHPRPRCEAERGRSMHQARLFAELCREGSWVDARIDTAKPDQQPMPAPDVRSVMLPVGPVVVFGASNFPIAISVLGSDTVSAFAAGCPVVVKAHPAHPGTCELAARAIFSAIEKCGLPKGIFSLVQGKSNEVGAALVSHPQTAAAAFTGSLGGGRALFDIANARPKPIPFYAEMGSVNPIFVLPGALEERAGEIGNGFVTSLTTGVGQFCTNPGLVFGLQSEKLDSFKKSAAAATSEWQPATMLHAGIHHAFETGVGNLKKMPELNLVAESADAPDPAKAEAACYLFEADAAGFRAHPELLDEVFGPVSTVVGCESPTDFEAFARQLDGSLTASIHGTEADLKEHAGLISILEEKIGRLIFNGYPVGLEVNHSIHHGGPYPATCHSHFTSIGTRCINRFVRPVCYQNWPDSALPDPLKNDNPLGIWRIIDGERTQAGSE